jgi:hypothetical protein
MSSYSIGVGPTQPNPGLLDGILGVTGRAEHAVGNCPEMGAVLLEAICQPGIKVVLGHWSTSSHRSSSGLTGETSMM